MEQSVQGSRKWEEKLTKTRHRKWRRVRGVKLKYVSSRSLRLWIQLCRVSITKIFLPKPAWIKRDRYKLAPRVVLLAFNTISQRRKKMHWNLVQGLKWIWEVVTLNSGIDISRLNQIIMHFRNQGLSIL